MTINMTNCTADGQTQSTCPKCGQKGVWTKEDSSHFTRGLIGVIPKGISEKCFAKDCTYELPEGDAK